MISCDVWIDGTPLPDGAAGDRSAPLALDELTIRWGRESTVDQPEPAACSLRILDRGGGTVRGDQLIALGSGVRVSATVPGVGQALVFLGRVTDLDVAWDDGVGGAVVEVIAVDLMGELANRFVGAEPWAQETLSARAGRINTALGGSGTVTVDARPAALPVSRMDVDRQSGADLYRELATSGSGVVWVVVPPATGQPVLRIEDPAARPSMAALVQDTDLLWKIEDTGAAAYPIDACRVLREPVAWQRATSDLVTRVTVRWLDQTTSPDPTERSVGTVDTQAETTYGARGLSVGTILASQAAADSAMALLLAAHKPAPTWLTSGLTWDTGVDPPADDPSYRLAAALLDNQARIGLPLNLINLPYWAPSGAAAGMYVEGGAYTYVGGAWVLELLGVPPAGLGGTLTCERTDRSIRYADVDPTIRYMDMAGVGPAGPTGATWGELVGPWSGLVGSWMEL